MAFSCNTYSTKRQPAVPQLAADKLSRQLGTAADSVYGLVDKYISNNRPISDYHCSAEIMSPFVQQILSIAPNRSWQVAKIKRLSGKRLRQSFDACHGRSRPGRKSMEDRLRRVCNTVLQSKVTNGLLATVVLLSSGCANCRKAQHVTNRTPGSFRLRRQSCESVNA